jgi:MFS family permease
VAEGPNANDLLTTLAGGLLKGNPQFGATGGKPVSKRSLRALDWANFFLSDVRDGIGPYLGIYLLASHHWDAGSIGVAMAATGVATVVAQTPAGALIDATTHKKLLVSGASLVVALSCILMTVYVTLPVVVFFQILMGIAAAILLPATAALTLGLVGYARYPRRQGRNEVFNHAGNMVAAILAGLAGQLIALEWLFYAVAISALGSIVSVMMIRTKDIDDELARGARGEIAEGEEETPAQISGFKALFASKPLLIFALSIVLFHFANAAMLPLAGQSMTAASPSGASTYMSACIIIAQLVMIPVAKFTGDRADSWGRRPLFLIAFSVLPIRGLLYTFSASPYWIVGVQALDGIGAGIFGVLWVIVVADLTRGTGRYNVTLGAIATAVSLGAALSNLVAGYVVNWTGYPGGFLFLAACAALALIVFYFGVPETRPTSLRGDDRTPRAPGRLELAAASG